MATSIPTFKLDITEGMIDVNASADRLYGYCIEASKGPVMEPTFCASANEVQRLFGVDFKPHFYQNPTGIVICRVAFDGMEKAKVEYKAKALKKKEDSNEYEIDSTAANEFVVLTIESTTEGPSNSKVTIEKSKSGSGYNVSITTDATSKTYQNVSTLEKVVRKINSRFGTYLKASLSREYYQQVNPSNKVPIPGDITTTPGIGQKFQRDQFIFLDKTAEGVTKEQIDNYGKLKDGSNGTMKTTKGEPSTTLIDEIDNIVMTENMAPTAPNPEVTRLIAYQAAFEKIQEVDLIGISTISDSPSVQSALALHIEEVTDPEVHQLRFGITGYTDYVAIDENGTHTGDKHYTALDNSGNIPTGKQVTADDIIGQASILDSEWMIFIGQGVVFEDEYGVRRNVLPHEATQLYTGIRSALGYSEAIFGGEQKKVLNGVVDTLPVVTDGTDITKDLIEEFNESGVCTFKKEYGEVTFVEGVTTVQDKDVLSYENMMSIVAHVSKRLIKVAKPYQGQRLTEDLKSTLTTALLKELKDITETDGTLMELEEFNIPPYNVSVEAASKTMWDDHNLIRVSKIIIRCRIVPVGALRDIDLGIIAI